MTLGVGGGGPKTTSSSPWRRHPERGGNASRHLIGGMGIGTGSGPSRWPNRTCLQKPSDQAKCITIAAAPLALAQIERLMTPSATPAARTKANQVAAGAASHGPKRPASGAAIAAKASGAIASGMIWRNLGSTRPRWNVRARPEP